jgi:hypothetical protein
MVQTLKYFGIGFGGVAAGVVGADTEFAGKLLDAFVGILDQHGFEISIAVFLIVSTVALSWHLLREIIASKNAEIDRLSKLRDQLWDQYISERPRSGHSNNETWL